MDCEKIIAKVKKLSIAFRRNVPFSELTTFGCGGKIALTIFPDSIKKLVKIIKFLSKSKVNYVVLGRGSNVLASDDFFDGVVICTNQLKKLYCKGNTITAECGASTAKISQLCTAKGMTGGEFLACLPASIGGATVCNAGCFGQTMQNVVVWVKALYRGRIRKFYARQCGFSYRNSIFKGGKTIVLQVQLAFRSCAKQIVKARVESFKHKKSQTQPLACKCAGCVFYHPNVHVSALIDQAGLKGYQIGGAKISKKHAGFVVNIDKATSKDIYLLIDYIKKTILTKYNIQPKLELCLINFDGDTNDFFAND